MRLTTHTDYAIRVLIFVAVHESQRGTIRDIAQAYGISRNHLMKVVHELQQKGYLTTIRGKGGGVVLAARPKEINLGAVVRDMEPDLGLAECFRPHNQCVITPDCHLKHLLNEALQAFLGTLDRYSLEDITRNEAQALRHSLGLINL